MIRNLQPDPYSRARPRWSLYTNVTEDPADGRRIYSCADATQQLWAFSVLQQGSKERFGRTLVSVLEFGRPVVLAGTTLLRINCADDVTIHRISDTRYWISGCLNDRGSLWHELQFETAIDTTVKLLGSALYTPEDWMLVQEMADTGVLRIPWFAVPNSGSGEIGPQPVLMP